MTVQVIFARSPKTAHEQLDRTVAAAYGWTDYGPSMKDSDVRARLLALNLSRSGIA